MRKPDTVAADERAEERLDDVVTIEASTVEEAMARLADEVGPEARIISAEKAARGGVGGFFAKEMVVITAHRPERDQSDLPGALERMSRDADAREEMFGDVLRRELADHRPNAGLGSFLEATGWSGAPQPGASEEPSPAATVDEPTTPPPAAPSDSPDVDEASSTSTSHVIASDGGSQVTDRGTDLMAPRPVPVGPMALGLPATSTSPGGRVNPIVGMMEHLVSMPGLAALAASGDLAHRVEPTPDTPHDVEMADPTGSGVEASVPTLGVDVSTSVQIAEPVRTSETTDIDATPLGEPVAHRAAPDPGSDEADGGPHPDLPPAAETTRPILAPVAAPPGLGAPGWGVTELVRHGVPAPLVSAVTGLDPLDDLAWIEGLASAVGEWCGPLPTGDTVIVGTGADRLAATLDLPLVRLGDVAPYHGSFCSELSGAPDDRAWLDFVRGGRTLHFVLGEDELWRDLLVADPAIVSWIGQTGLIDALYLATTLGATLGFGALQADDPMLRAHPVDIALSLRHVIGRT